MLTSGYDAVIHVHAVVYYFYEQTTRFSRASIAGFPSEL